MSFLVRKKVKATAREVEREAEKQSDLHKRENPSICTFVSRSPAITAMVRIAHRSDGKIMALKYGGLLMPRQHIQLFTRWIALARICSWS